MASVGDRDGDGPPVATPGWRRVPGTPLHEPVADFFNEYFYIFLIIINNLEIRRIGNGIIEFSRLAKLFLYLDVVPSAQENKESWLGHD